jgi:hypothetical protein
MNKIAWRIFKMRYFSTNLLAVCTILIVGLRSYINYFKAASAPQLPARNWGRLFGLQLTTLLIVVSVSAWPLKQMDPSLLNKTNPPT